MVKVKNDSAMEITDQEFESLISSNDLVLVDFFADWCMPCVMLAPIIEELAESMKNVKFAKINVDENQEYAEKFGVRSIPTLIIFKDGKEVERIVGNQTGEDIEDKLNKLMG